MSETISEPERALRCYERWSGLQVVVHDLVGGLTGQLPPTRHRHEQALCRAVKTGPHGARCLAWEIPRLRSVLAAEPTARIQVCHAGLVELVAPLLFAGRLGVVLFAGQRLPGGDLEAAADPVRSPVTWSHRASMPARWSADEAEFALEGLRQLGARLRAWLGEQPHLALGTGQADSGQTGGGPTLDRRRSILDFIALQCTGQLSLTDLATHLQVGPHRAAHVVRDLCGTTFVALVTDARMRIASSLLHTTDLAVPEVARRSGFGDANHFHRLFRRRFGTTPHRYRNTASES